MKKNLITEQLVIDIAKRGQKSLSFVSGSIITDAARDRAKQLGIELISGKQDSDSGMPSPVPTEHNPETKSIAIGSDHGGFALKAILKPYLESLGYNVVDLGTTSDEACDYPDFALAVARMVSLGDVSRGIMIDAIGNASAIVANKIVGIRAACCTDEFSARSASEHNNVNVLTLGGRVLGPEIAKAITKTWLESSYLGGRHQKRIDKITEIEGKRFTLK